MKYVRDIILMKVSYLFFAHFRRKNSSLGLRKCEPHLRQVFAMAEPIHN